MTSAYKNLRECILTNPLGISLLPKKIRRLVDSYFPFSTGIEIECERIKQEYIHIEDYMNKIGVINFSSEPQEQRFRLCKGEAGIITLYKLCEYLTKYGRKNVESGIHYHIDCTPFFSSIQEDKGNGLWWILRELDRWKYKGRYNERSVSVNKANWVRIHSYHKTLEFRIGEMTFDYEVMIRRILHCQSIVKRVRKQYETGFVKPAAIETGQVMFNGLRLTDCDTYQCLVTIDNSYLF